MLHSRAWALLWSVVLTLRGGNATVNTVRAGIDSRLRRLEQRVEFVHNALGEVLCKDRYNDVSETGAWCLRKESESYGIPMAPLHFLDEVIADYILSLVGNDTVVDIGAGSGQYCNYFTTRRPALECASYDGAINVEAFTRGRVLWADLAKPLHLPYAYDWVMSLEVGEHLPAVFESQFLDNLHRWNHRGVILSWAVPGQPGKGHVNCLSNADVIRRMRLLGYAHVPASEAVRANAQLEWFRNTFMVFRKETFV
jgi:hypothetical protein